MAIINPPVGGQARSIHVQQLINWLRGIPSYSEAVSFTGITSNSGYALTAANRGTGGLAFAAKNSALTKTLFEVKEAGVIVRPNAASGTAFRIRNFADDADLFNVDVDGSVSLGSGTIATLTATQTLTNKTLTSPIINTGRIGDALDITQQASDPANPSANNFRLYALLASNILRFRDSSGTVYSMVDTSSAQSLFNKTLVSPTINTPTITSVSLDAPVVSNYASFAHSSNPGGTASRVKMWTDTSNNVFVTTPGGTIGTVLTSINTPSVSGLGWARQLLVA